MNFLKRVFKIIFDDDAITTNDDGTQDVKVDYEAILNEDEKKDDEDPENNEDDSKDNEDEDNDEDPEDEDDPEDNDEDPEDEDNDEGSNNNVDNEDEDNDNHDWKKRTRDTQRALSKEKLKNDALTKRVEALEVKKKDDAESATEDGKKKEVTLLTIDQKVLQDAMKTNPIDTQRWIADQQVKISLDKQRVADVEEQKGKDLQERIDKSEDEAFKEFPILQTVLDMDEIDLKDLAKSEPEQYEFAQKTILLYDIMQKRGDEEALVNAASRVYRQLSPKTIKVIREKAKMDAKKELSHRKKVLGKVKVAQSKGQGKGNKGGFKSLSDKEFAALTPLQQDKHMEASVRSKISKGQ